MNDSAPHQNRSQDHVNGSTGRARQWAERGVRGRLLRKYVAVVAGVVLVALVANGVIDALATWRDHQAALVRIQQEQAEAAAEKIGRFVREIEAQLGWTTLLPWADGTPETRKVDAQRLLKQVPAISEFIQIDGTGRERLRVSRLAPDVYGSGLDLSTDPQFALAMDDGVYYGPVYFRRESEPYMTLAAAGLRRINGVSVAEVNLKFIWDVVSRISAGKDGLVYVVDRKGRLMAHPDIGLVLRQTDMSHLAQVRVAIDGQPGIVAPEAVDLDGVPVLSASAQIAPLGWIVFVELPVAEAYAPLYAAIERIALILLVTLALAVSAGALLAHRMVAPIRALGEGAARIGKGELSQRIDIETGDELESLAAQFNDMAARLQESYAGLERKVEERTRDLAEALERQTATSDILRAISGSPTNVQPVFEAIVHNAVTLCGSLYANVFRFDGERLHLGASYNVGKSYVELLKEKYPMRPDRSQVSGRVILDRAVVQLEDPLADPDYDKRFPTAGQWRRMLGVPLMRDCDVVGVIVVGWTEAGPISPRHEELLKTFADQAVIAIENVRLFDEVQARTRDLTETLEQQTATSDILRMISSSPTDVQPVFNMIAERAAQLCGARFCHVFRLDQGILQFVADYGLAPDAIEAMNTYWPRPPDLGSAAGRAVLNADVVEIPDVHLDPDYALTELTEVITIRGIVAVPILRDGVAIGAIAVTRAETGRFPDRQVALLKTFADQAVIAIENVRLFTELESRNIELARSVEELRALGEVSQTVNSTLDLETVLDTIVTKAVQLSGGDAGSIYVFDPERAEFRLRANYGLDVAVLAALRGHRIRAGDTAVGIATVERRALQIADVEQAPQAKVPDVLLRAGYRSFLVVPLLGAESVVGALVVRRKAIGDFPQSTVELLQTFATQSVLAIQNARLFREFAEKSRELEIASQHKSQFLANMSHELRTPLNAILGYSELILDDIYGEPPEKMREVLERVLSNGRYLLGLINDVLDLSKIEAGQLTLSLADYSLADVLHTVHSGLESLAAEKGLTFLATAPQDLPVGHGDERRLAQVLLNLAGNAIKFTDVGEVTIDAQAANGAFRIAVRDTGPGIAPEDQERIFEEFQQVDSTSTRQKGGSGLGLAISKRIVEMHGGRISVESEPGRGSTFTISLPVTVEQQAEAS